MNPKLPFLDNGMVSSLLRSHDWSDSVLGDPAQWPLSLKTVVQLILNSKFPMFVAWGPELGFLYNDAYAPILGNKHPAALGARLQDVWGEVWADIHPIIDSALSGQASYFEDLPVILARNGFPEQTWFTFSYAPVHDDEGRVRGVYCTVVETTKRVFDERLRQFQLELADRLYTLTLPENIVKTATEMLGRRLDASGCWYAEIDDVAGTFYTRAGWFAETMMPLPKSGTIADFSPHLLPQLRTGEPFVCSDLRTDPRTRDFADRFDALHIGSILIVPLLKDERVAININVIHPGPHVWTEEEIRTTREVLERTRFAVENSIAQQQLAYERNQSDQILNSMEEGFMLIDEDGLISKINACGLRTLQLDGPAVLGKPATALWSSQAADRTDAAPREMEWSTSSGQTLWLETRAHEVTTGGVAVFFRDITTSKRALLALRDSEAHLTALFGQTSAGIMESDLAGKLIRVNERMGAILGRPSAELLGLNLHELTHPDDRPSSEAAFQRLLTDGHPFAIEKRYIRPDGRSVWVNATVSIIRPGDERVTASVLSVIVDVSERKRIEAALEQETRFLDLLNRTGQAFSSTLDLSTLLQTITDSGRELTGAQFAAFFYNAKRPEGEAYQLYTLSGAPREAFERFGYPRPTAIFKPTFDGEAVIRSDDITLDPRYGKMAPHYGMPKGHLPVRSYLAASVISRSGEVLGGLLFGHPQPRIFNARTERLITGLVAQAAIAIDNARLYELAQQAAAEREELLSRERAARAEAERMNRSKDEFLAMLAHELRNPLAPVSAAADVLRLHGNDPARTRQVSDIISRQIRHFARLIDDLMDVSRVTRGLIQIDLRPVDLKTLVGTAIEQARPMIEYRQHRLITRMDADHAVVLGDRTRLVQVVTNLLTNAAKYTPQNGEITLRVEADARCARIIVTDDGNGIDAKLLPHVFDLFTQGSRGLDRNQGGLGIGLALVKSIVGLHDGRVTAASDGPGHGSTFTIELPLLNEAIATPAKTDLDEPRHFRRLAILLVDDNLDGANALATLLKILGHQVAVAGTAKEALKMAELDEFDAFILDIGLPDLTGYELAKTLRGRSGLSKKLFIALTGYGQPQDRRDAQAAGFDHHFVKPVDIQQLTAALNEAAPETRVIPPPVSFK